MIRRKTKSNPTDHDLISKLTVKKSFPDYGTMYEVYLGKRRIGFADIDRGKTEISFVNINEEYRRKGISSFLYDYIEKDLGRKLKPSADLLDDGEAFWNARSRRSNPRDEALLKQIKIKKEIKKHFFNYYILLNDKIIGQASIWKNKKEIATYSSATEILKAYQQKGLTTYLYDYIEQDLGIKLEPSDIISDNAKAFWKNRLKKTK